MLELGFEAESGGRSCDRCVFHARTIDGQDVCRLLQVDGLAAAVDPQGGCGCWERDEAFPAGAGLVAVERVRTPA